VIVTARLQDGQVAILGVLPDRHKVTVQRFLLSISAPLRATIEHLCTDIYEGYIQAAREALPPVHIVIDRFDEQPILTRLFGYSIEIAAAHLLREELTVILEQVQSQAQAQEKLQAWQERVDIAASPALMLFSILWITGGLKLPTALSTATPAASWKA
jgi:hypothetical protein